MLRSNEANAALLHDVSQFLYREADLLDRRDFHGWLELFADDGVYWVPSSADQTDFKGQVSIVLEDKLILRMRVDRLNNPQAQATMPQFGTVHFVSNIFLDGDESDSLIRVRSCVALSDANEQREMLLTGRALHELVPHGDGFRIHLKRVDLTQAGGIFDPINIPI